MFTATIHRRRSADFVNDPLWRCLSQKSSLVIGGFCAAGRKLEVALVQTGRLDKCGPDEVYAFGCDQRWAALARDTSSHEVVAVYEFFVGPADLIDTTITGAKLVGKAIEVDRNHLAQGVAMKFVECLYRAGLEIVPSGHFTPEGAALMNKLATHFSIPIEGTVTKKWPPEG